MSGIRAPNWFDARQESRRFVCCKDILADVYFIVGKEDKRQRIPAHKIFLFTSSPVFAAMFGGGLAAKADTSSSVPLEINLTDVEPASFISVLRYIYLGEINIDAETVMSTLYTAKKYAVTPLEKACVDFLTRNLSTDNVFLILSQARLFDEHALAERCLDFIDAHTEKAMDGEGFTDIDLQTLCIVLKRDSLGARELPLFEAACRWAEAECRRRGEEATGEQKRKALGEAFNLIRFPLLTLKEFAEGPAGSGLFSDVEIGNLILSFHGDPRAVVPFSHRIRHGEQLRSQPESNGGFLANGSFTWDVPVADIGEKEIFSPFTTIDGCSFRLKCKTASKSGNQELFVSLHCSETASTGTSGVAVGVSLKLASSKTPATHDAIYRFVREDAYTDNRPMCGWAAVQNPANGFIHDGLLTFEVGLKIFAYLENAVADFSVRSPLSDVILVVGGEEIHVNKAILAIFSGFFKNLFFSDFADKYMERVELPSIDAKDFKMLLQVIYPERYQPKITEDNVRSILHLAVFFDVQPVIWECSDFLEEEAYVDYGEALQLAEKYQLYEHLNELLKVYYAVDYNEDVDEYAVIVKKAMDSSFFKTYSEYTKHALRDLYSRLKPE